MVHQKDSQEAVFCCKMLKEIDFRKAFEGGACHQCHLREYFCTPHPSNSMHWSLMAECTLDDAIEGASFPTLVEDIFFRLCPNFLQF